jgi:hypothetical protein
MPSCASAVFNDPKPSAGGNLERKPKPLFCNALRLARKGSPAPMAKVEIVGIDRRHDRELRAMRAFR